MSDNPPQLRLLDNSASDVRRFYRSASAVCVATWIVVAIHLGLSAFAIPFFEMACCGFALVLPLIGLYAIVSAARLRPHNGPLLAVAGSAVLIAVAVVTAVRLGEILRDGALERATERGEVLIKAISDYERDHGAPPQSLDDLVPSYIAQVPGTGLRSYPDFELHVLTSSTESCWELRISTPLFLDVEEIYYRPTFDYGPRDRRIGQWAYRRLD